MTSTDRRSSPGAPHGDAIQAYEKGTPGSRSPILLETVLAQHWNVLREDLSLPVAVLKQSALQANRDRMRSFLKLTGAKLAPHGKTTMCPDLFDMQLADGAWAITVATPHQIQVGRYFGYQRLFLANQLVGKRALDYVVSELRADPAFEFYCLVDSLATIRQLEAAARRGGLGRPILALVEMGYTGGRTGCRSVEQALEVAEEVARSANAVALCGVEGFEGLIRGSDAEQRQTRVERFLDDVIEVARRCDERGLFATDSVLLSAGGSAHFDLVARKLSSATLSRPATVLLRSGCYLTHDSGLYVRAALDRRARSPALERVSPEYQAALEVWGYVQSRPEDALAIVGVGKRDISYDDLPVPLYWSRSESAQPTPHPLPPGHRITALNDQHAYLEVPRDTPLAVGDMIGLGVSHPCLTFDKWRVLHLVDAEYNVMAAMRTYF